MYYYPGNIIEFNLDPSQPATSVAVLTWYDKYLILDPSNSETSISILIGLG